MTPTAPSPLPAPAYGPPRPPAWVFLWPAAGRGPTRAVLVASAAAAALAAVTGGVRPGLGWALTGTAVALVAVCALPGGARGVRRLGWDRQVSGVLSLALQWVVVVRDAPWLVALCLLGVVGCASLALTGARTATGALLTAVTVPLAALRALPWTARAVTSGADARDRVPAVRAVAATFAVLVVFTVLLAGADVVFASTVGRLIPDLGFSETVGRVVLAGLIGGLALGCAFVAASPPRWDSLAPAGGRPARRLEWALPLLALDGLLSVFLTTRLVAARGGADAVLREEGITYAAYAREGFAHLVVVSLLVLVVLAVVGRYAPHDGAAGRSARRLRSVLCLLALGVVVSALHRLFLYEREYGLTSARLSAAVLEAWIGLVLLIALVRILRRRGSWLVPTLLLSAAAVLLGFAVADPDAVVARHGVDRYLRTGEIDAAYLSTLSADAVPALDRLPEPVRSCVLRDVAVDTGPQGLTSAAIARHRARTLLRDRPPLDVTALECARAAGALG